MANPGTVIVIVNWNGEKFLEACLRSVFAQDYADFKVIFADNGSTDGSVAFVKNNYPRVEILSMDKNYGFARANNIAIEKALKDGAQYIALLNNDTKVETNWLASLVRVMSADIKIGICASKMLKMDAPGILDSTGHVFMNGLIFDRGNSAPDRGQYDEQLDVAGACAGACLYRRTMLENIGLFDESFGSYCEDAELSWRAHKAGWKAKYVPGSVVYHKGHGSSEGNDELQEQIGAQGSLNLVRTVRRHASIAGKLRVTAVWLKEAAQQRAARLIFGKAIKPDYWERVKMLWSRKL